MINPDKKCEVKNLMKTSVKKNHEKVFTIDS